MAIYNLAEDLLATMNRALDGGYFRTSKEELTLRVEIAKLAQLELLNQNLLALGAAIRNKGVG